MSDSGLRRIRSLDRQVPVPSKVGSIFNNLDQLKVNED